MERPFAKRPPRLGKFQNIVAHVELTFDQAFKHIFTSPSSVDQEPKATHSGNAQIHGMCFVTKASIAYVATQVRLSQVHDMFV